eukprot:662531-Karenia_brevis.AAC.1
MLLEIGVAEPLLYRMHDLRRGHAEDLRASGKISLISTGALRAHECNCSGAPLGMILAAGEW